MFSKFNVHVSGFNEWNKEPAWIVNTSTFQISFNRAYILNLETSTFVTFNSVYGCFRFHNLYFCVVYAQYILMWHIWGCILLVVYGIPVQSCCTFLCVLGWHIRSGCIFSYIFTWHLRFSNVYFHIFASYIRLSYLYFHMYSHDISGFLMYIFILFAWYIRLSMQEC